MIAISLLVLMVVIVAVAIVTSRAGHPAPATPPLRDQLNRWVTAGLLDAGQAAAIEAHEASLARDAVPAVTAVSTPVLPTSPPQAGATPPPATALPTTARPHQALGAVVEALGYLGSVLAVSGVVLLVAHYWDDLAMVGQLALSGVTAVTLAGSGAAVPESRAPAMARLRAFLWTLSTAAVAVFAATAAREVLGTPPVGPVVATTAAAVAVTSGLMWWGRRRPVQQLLALAAGVISVGVGANEVIGKTGAGLAVWMIGAAFVVLGIRRVTTAPALDVTVGALAFAAGSIVTVAEDPGIGLLFVVLSGAVLVTLALLRRLIDDVASILALCGVGGITMLQSLPPLVVIMAEDAAIITGTVLWTVSLGIAAVGVRRITRVPLVLEVLGALGMLAGCAVMAINAPAVATIAGLITSLGLLGVSLSPGRVALSPVGAAGLLAFVPWTISWFFPGEGRVPLLISVSGVLIIAVAVLMARSGHRFGTELGHQPQPPDCRDSDRPATHAG